MPSKIRSQGEVGKWNLTPNYETTYNYLSSEHLLKGPLNQVVTLNASIASTASTTTKRLEELIILIKHNTLTNYNLKVLSVTVTVD